MASSGSLLTNGWYSSSKDDYVYLEFAWSVTNTSIENNQKTIYWELRGKRKASGYVNAGGFKVVIDGETVYSKSTDYRVELYNGTIVASGSKTFTHKPDGTRSFSVYIEGGIYTYAVNNTGSKSFDLDTIPRASTISCTEANIESNPLITISRASSNFTHTITYQFGTLTGTIVEKTSATSITNWTIPAEFYAQIPDAKRGYGTLTCTTYNGATQIGTSPCTFWVSTDETKCKPGVSGDVVIDDETNELTGRQDTLIRYFSIAMCDIGTSLKKSAGSIKVKTINNIAVSGSALDIHNVETGVFDFYAEDSRGYFNSYKWVAKELVPYIKLTAEVTIQRTDPTSGNATLKIEGNYYNGKFGGAEAESNSLSVSYRQGNSGSFISVTPTISTTDSRYSVTINLTGLDYTKSFDFEVVVQDAITRIPKTATLPKGIPVFDWGEDDFNFNVPVIINGVNILEKLAELEARLAEKG